MKERENDREMEHALEVKSHGIIRTRVKSNLWINGVIVFLYILGNEFVSARSFLIFVCCVRSYNQCGFK